MHTLRAYFIAVLLGAALAWAAVTAMGTLAAIAIPAEFFAAHRHSPVPVFVLTTTLLVQFPAILLASLVGWGFFRLTRHASMRLLAAIALPWVALVVIWSRPFFSSAGLTLVEKLEIFFSWQALPGTLSIPIGLAAAYLAVRRRQKNVL